MLAAQRQARKRAKSTGDCPADKIDSNSLAVYSLAVAFLAGRSGIMVNEDFVDSIAGKLPVLQH